MPLNHPESGLLNLELGGKNNYGVYLINESGLYLLIFSSRLPAAKTFKHWVTSEVLPTMRQIGFTRSMQILQEENMRLQNQLNKLQEENNNLYDCHNSLIDAYEFLAALYHHNHFDSIENIELVI